MVFNDIKLSEIKIVAEVIVNLTSTNPIVLFDAQMGAGKTTLIKEVCSQLGIEGQVASPTFAIVNVYLTNFGEEVYHFDLYRVEKVVDAFEIGFNEYIESGNICLIEWPQIMAEYFPANSVKVEIQPGSKEDRRNFNIIIP